MDSYRKANHIYPNHASFLFSFTSLPHAITESLKEVVEALSHNEQNLPPSLPEEARTIC